MGMFWKDSKERLVVWACPLKAQGRKERCTIRHKSLFLFWAISVVLRGHLMAPIQARHVLSWWCVAKQLKGVSDRSEGKDSAGDTHIVLHTSSMPLALVCTNRVSYWHLRALHQKVFFLSPEGVSVRSTQDLEDDSAVPIP